MTLQSLVAKYGVTKLVLAGAVATTVAVGGGLAVNNAINNPSKNGGVNGGNNGTNTIVDQQNGETDQGDLVLSKTEEVVEYGQYLSMNPSDYLVAETDATVLANTTPELYEVVDGKVSDKQVIVATAPLGEGEYRLVLVYGEERENVKVNVIDNNSPEITLKQNKVTLEYGAKFNAKDYVESVKDPVDGNLDYTVEGEVNTKKAGEYTVTIKAKDKHGNEAEEAKIHVTVKEKKNEGGSTSGTSNKDHDEDAKPSDDKDDNIGGRDDVDQNGPGGTNPNDPGNQDEEVKESPNGANTNTNIKEESKEESKSDNKSNTEKEEVKEEVYIPTVEDIYNKYPYLIGDSGKVFATKEEAKAWAKAQVEDENSQWYGKNYTVKSCTIPGNRVSSKDPRTVNFH